MITNKTVRDKVRKRANFACEYCGVLETNTGGLLTIDHFQPISKGGNDHIRNLVYACIRCNSYKYNYFPSCPEDPILWNPRIDSRNQHFFELEDGSLKALSPKGSATITILRLNRPALVKYRLLQKVRLEERQLLERYQQLMILLRQTNGELSGLVKNQQNLLQQQQQLLKLLLKDN